MGKVEGITPMYFDRSQLAWEARGGVVLGKIDFLREVMHTYGVDKPLMLTEGALICPTWSVKSCSPPDFAFYESQADYVVWLYVRNWAAGIMGTVWFTFDSPGWNYGPLLNLGQQPKPAYYALQFFSQELKEAVYLGRLNQFDGLAGYEFSAADKRIWVFWAADEQPHPLQLPPETLRVLDKYGTDITPETGMDLIVNTPIYVELTP